MGVILFVLWLIAVITWLVARWLGNAWDKYECEVLRPLSHAEWLEMTEAERAERFRRFESYMRFKKSKC